MLSNQSFIKFLAVYNTRSSLSLKIPILYIVDIYDVETPILLLIYFFRDSRCRRAD